MRVKHEIPFYWCRWQFTLNVLYSNFRRSSIANATTTIRAKCHHHHPSTHRPSDSIAIDCSTWPSKRKLKFTDLRFPRIQSSFGRWKSHWVHPVTSIYTIVELEQRLQHMRILIKHLTFRFDFAVDVDIYFPFEIWILCTPHTSNAISLERTSSCELHKCGRKPRWMKLVQLSIGREQRAYQFDDGKYFASIHLIRPENIYLLCDLACYRPNESRLSFPWFLSVFPALSSLANTHFPIDSHAEWVECVSVCVRAIVMSHRNRNNDRIWEPHKTPKRHSSKTQRRGE